MTADERLKVLFDDALGVLLPAFEISDSGFSHYARPSLVVSDKSQYNFVNNELSLSADHLERPVVVGEEVSHFLHSNVNPQVFLDGNNRNTYYYFARALAECVGRYGGLLYGATKGSYEKASMSVGVEPGEGMFHVWHNEGYRRAEKLFELYGRSLLPRVARMSTDEAFDVLHRLAPASFWERRVLPVIDRIKGYKAV